MFYNVPHVLRSTFGCSSHTSRLIVLTSDIGMRHWFCSGIREWRQIISQLHAEELFDDQSYRVSSVLSSSYKCVSKPVVIKTFRHQYMKQRGDRLITVLILYFFAVNYRNAASCTWSAKQIWKRRNVSKTVTGIWGMYVEWKCMSNYILSGLQAFSTGFHAKWPNLFALFCRSSTRCTETDLKQNVYSTFRTIAEKAE